MERLRNGGVPRNPVFLMPATHCRREEPLAINNYEEPLAINNYVRRVARGQTETGDAEAAVLVD